MTVYQLVLLSAACTRFTVKSRYVVFSGTRDEILDKLKGEFMRYRNRNVFWYEVSCSTYSIVVYLT